MIILYSGTPGSGKSYHATAKAVEKLKFGRNVIANFPLSFNKRVFSKRQRNTLPSHFQFWANNDLTVPRLIQYSLDNHVKGKEHQTLIIIDEAGIKFNSRDWQSKDRMQWLDFFSQHRKFGFDVILVSQSEMMLDKQIRCFIETEENHRAMRQCGLVGIVLSPLVSFVDIESWHGNGMRLGISPVMFKKSIADCYDSYTIFDNNAMDRLLKVGAN